METNQQIPTIRTTELAEHAGARVRLRGWLHATRRMGGVNFVVLRDGAQLSEDEIKAYVKENLANYKIPREVVFLDELPRNPTGKILKRQLLEAADGATPRQP